MMLEQQNKEIRQQEFNKALGVEAGKKVTYGAELKRELGAEAAKSEQGLALEELQAGRKYEVERFLKQEPIGEAAAKTFATAATVSKRSGDLALDLVDFMKQDDGRIDMSQLPVGPAGKGWWNNLANRWGLKPSEIQARIKFMIAEMMQASYDTTGRQVSDRELKTVVEPTIAAINESPQLFINKFSEFQKMYRDKIVNYMKTLEGAGNKDLREQGQELLNQLENMPILNEQFSLQPRKRTQEKSTEGTQVQTKGKSYSGIADGVIKQWQKNPGKPISDGTYIYFKHPQKGWVVSKIPEK
jgi:hypothetical protein